MYGLSDEEIAAVLNGNSEPFVPPEVALLRMAYAMADTPSNVSDELYAELRRHFSEEQLIELAAWAAMDFLGKDCDSSSGDPPRRADWLAWSNWRVSSLIAGTRPDDSHRARLASVRDVRCTFKRTG